jgi:hypothetical protein
VHMRISSTCICVWCGLGKLNMKLNKQKLKRARAARAKKERGARGGGSGGGGSSGEPRVRELAAEAKAFIERGRPKREALRREGARLDALRVPVVPPARM